MRIIQWEQKRKNVRYVGLKSQNISVHYAAVTPVHHVIGYNLVYVKNARRNEFLLYTNKY